MKVENEKMLLSFTVVLFYLCFQTFLILTATHLDGECLHNVWLNADYFVTPFHGFLISVVLILCFGVLLGVMRIKQKGLSLPDALFYITYVAVLGFWLSGLGDMWRTFEYEKGNISAAKYYQGVSSAFLTMHEPFSCKKDNLQNESLDP